MVCQKCHTVFEGKFCPSCGEKAPKKLPNDRLKSLLHDQSEQLVSVLANGMAERFLATGVLENGFAVLSNKRVYFKGTCLIRRGSFFYKKQEEKSVALDDITGTGIVHNKAPWAKIAAMICGGFGIFCLLATIISCISDIITGQELQEISPIDFTLMYILLFATAICIFLYKRLTYSVFEISYAGGGIAFDMRWITAEESQDFIRNINLLKDRNKAGSFDGNNTPEPPPNDDIPEQLKKYKDLLDAGIITQEEFEAKKKQLLGI